AGHRLGGTASDSSSFLTDKVRRKVDGMNLPSDWLRPGDVPGTWQQNIAQHADELERLEGVFRQGFDDRRVLVVDDLISSGRSVLVALSALSVAFPRAEFFGTALFKSDGRGKAADRRMVPWLSVPGMSGILEIPESDLISSRITDAETGRIRTVLREAFQGHMRVMLAHTKWFEPSSARLAQFVASCADADAAVRTRVQDGLAEMEGMIRTLQVTGTPEGFSRERCDSLVREQHELIRTIKTQIPTARHGEMDRLLNDVGDATPTNYEEFDAACDIWQRLGPEGYGSVRAMMERARALRAELKRLADEDSSPSVMPR
ncbi:phosphoribosyltransferase, partial [bacterium]|nr:phosphoribosyltransferase [bacterium]